MATVKAANLDGFEAARAIVRTDAGQQLMAGIRGEIALMVSEEGLQLKARDTLATALFSAAIAFVAGFIGVALWIAASGVRDLEHDFREERAEGEALGRTIAELRQRSRTWTRPRRARSC